MRKLFISSEDFATKSTPQSVRFFQQGSAVYDVSEHICASWIRYVSSKVMGMDRSHSKWWAWSQPKWWPRIGLVHNDESFFFVVVAFLIRWLAPKLLQKKGDTRRSNSVEQ